MPDQFTMLLDALQTEWEKAETYSHWDPPCDGQYGWRLERIKRNVGKENRISWELWGTIEAPQDAELNGKEWRALYFPASYLGFLKEFLITAIGEAPLNIKEADTMLTSLIGGLFAIDLKSTVDKNGAPRRNTSLARPIELPQLPA